MAEWQTDFVQFVTMRNPRAQVVITGLTSGPRPITELDIEVEILRMEREYRFRHDNDPED